MHPTLKSRIARLALPLAQQYIRLSPWKHGKYLLWRKLAWRGEKFLTTTKNGFQMEVRTNDLVQGYIYFFGVWEPNLTNFIKARLTELKGRTFIDVGANVGYFSLLAARIMEAGTVVSIEALPSIYESLAKNVEINGFDSIRTVNCAVVDKKCEVEMFYAGEANEGATTSTEGRFDSEPVVVEGQGLEDVLSDSEMETVRIIKIDVEGAEILVLTGLFPMVNRLPKDVEIVVEITPSAYEEKDLVSIFSTFENLGFFPYEIFNAYDFHFYTSNGQERPLGRVKKIPMRQTDIVFSRVDAAELAS